MSTRQLALAFASCLLACSSTSHSDLAPRADTGVKSPRSDTAGTDGSSTDDASPSDDASPPDDASSTDEAGDPGIDVFAGVAAFTPLTVKSGSGLVTKHNGEIGKTLSGTDCASSRCHDGSNREAPELAFGGTVYYGPDATKPAPGVEVRVRDATGKDYVVYSDSAGNFYQLGKASTFAWPAHAGVRDATDGVLMTAEFKTAGCNAAKCHDNSIDYPFITVPPPP